LYFEVISVSLKLISRSRTLRYSAITSALLTLFTFTILDVANWITVFLLIVLENLAFVSSVYIDRHLLLSAVEGLILCGATKKAMHIFRLVYSKVNRLVLSTPFTMLLAIGFDPRLVVYWVMSLAIAPLETYVVEKSV